MPIRHCQKCGLKVLIDESQAQTSVFYCQRCTTAMKSQEAAAMEAAVAVRPQTPIPSAPMASPKAATVKVLCPYCKASFNGRVPQKPARGACPVCQKELILLPNGDIRPAAGFDLGKWQQEQKEAPVALGVEPTLKEKPESGTKVLIKKYAADPAASKKADGGTRVVARTPVAEPPEPVAAPEPSDGGQGEEPAALPDWLEDAKSAPGRPPPPPADAPEPEPEPEPASEPESVRLDDLLPAGPPIDDAGMDLPSEVTAPTPINVRAVAAERPPAAVIPPPPPPPAPKAPPPAARATARKTDRRVAPGAGAMLAGARPTGAGKILLAYLLLFLPAAACPFVYGSRDKLKDSPLVKQLGERFQAGFHELHRRLVPPTAAPKPPPEEKKIEAPPEEKPKPGPEEQAQLEKQIDAVYMKYMRDKRTYDQRMKGATEAEKKEFEPVADRLKRDEERLRSLRDDYKKWFGKDYDPANQ